MSDTLKLAHAYRAAADAIAPLGRSGDPASQAPYRLAAIHAVELYLNALMLGAGHDPRSIRSLQHDLAARLTAASGCGLVLRRKTAEHLLHMTGAREYLLSRYDPQASATLSQLNRLAATLREVASKVTAIIERASSSPRPMTPSTV